MNGTLSAAVVPAAIPAATAGVGFNPGRTLAGAIAVATPSAIAGKTGPPRNPGAERQRVGQPLRDDEQDQQGGRALGDDEPAARSDPEEDEVDGAAGDNPKGDGKDADGETGDHQQADRPERRVRGDR